ncbi:S1 family peptidase [Polyangium mundeleinium]|uniref:Serine protease n=1 Tax=Polyangium mundeleinium TaxID=2995306 RepID=A0ABT5EWJ0_9BACT|nr:serine protease [Polyangium mundeleinium]MDC0746183.1 serine protease [Polyangium mundeleinium]
MSLVAQKLRVAAVDPAEPCLDRPVVRVRARFGKTWAASGTGFFIADWLSSIVTARHVVALADGAAPAEVSVRVLAGGRWVELEAVAVAYPSGGVAADDVAIVRVNARCTSELRMATLDASVAGQIWGYPLGNEAPRPPAVVPARARPSEGKVLLDRQGRIGMSGGPVVAVVGEGQPTAVVGIYLGPSPNGGGRAQTLAAPSVLASMEAAMGCA